MGSGLTRRAVILGKIQASEGVDPVPVAATDAILVSDFGFSVNGEPIERNFLRDSLSPLPYRQGRKLFEATFSFELKPGSALGIAPEWSPLARAAGMQETITPSTDVVYNFRDTAHEFATFYIYPDGLLIKCIDSIVDWTAINFNAGGIPIVQCRLQSQYATPTDVAIPAAVYDTHLPGTAENMAFTFESWATGVVPSFSVNFGTQIAERRDVNSPFGFKGMRYVGRAPTGQVTIEQELVAVFPFFTRWQNATEMAWSAHVGSAGSRVSMSSPSVQITGIRSTDIGGIRGLDCALRFNAPSTTKEFEITLD